MNISINSIVKTTKNKRAKPWKVIGIIKTLPLFEREGGGNAVYSGKQKQNQIC